MAWIGSHYGSNFLVGSMPNSLHKVEVWACARGYCPLGLCTYCFLPHQWPPQPLAEASLGEGWLVSWIDCGFHVAIRGWFDLGFVAVKRLTTIMALFRFSRPFRLLLLISLETFLVSPFSTSSTGLKASLISDQNCLWCFLSSCLPKGCFPRFPSYFGAPFFFFARFSFLVLNLGRVGLGSHLSHRFVCSFSLSLNHACFFWVFSFCRLAHKGKAG